MPEEKAKARKTVRAAQKQFERESAAANKARRKAFAQAQKEGLTLRDHRSRRHPPRLVSDGRGRDHR